MFVSIGAHPFVVPAPVFLVGAYGDGRRPNLMTAAWGGICASRPPCLAISLRPATWTHKLLTGGADFTVSLPSVAQVAQADYAGMVSGASLEPAGQSDKFAALGWTALPGDHVDAPYPAECPVVLELAWRHSLDLGSHTQFIGEIMDVKVQEECLRADGIPDPAAIGAMLFSPLAREYHATGPFVARAFAVGRTMRQK